MNKRSVVILIAVVSLILTAESGAQKETSYQELYDQGLQAYEQGQNDEAILLLEKVVEMKPDFAPAFNALGLARDASGKDISEVVWSFNVALELNPEYYEAYGNMCKSYYERGFFEQAQSACQKALEIAPGMLNYKLYLGWINLLGLNQPTQAIGYFQEVLEKIQNPMIYFGLGMAYAQGGYYAETLEMITELRMLGKNDLAIKLEATLRELSKPEATLPPAGWGETHTYQDHKDSQIVGKPQPEPPQEKSAPAPVGGQMRIQLRGQLQNLK